MLDLLELELQSCPTWMLGNEPRSLGKQPMFLTAKPFLRTHLPLIFCLRQDLVIKPWPVWISPSRSGLPEFAMTLLPLPHVCRDSGLFVPSLKSSSKWDCQSLEQESI